MRGNVLARRRTRDRSDFVEQSEPDPATVPEFPDNVDHEHLAVREYALRSACHNRIRLERGGDGT